MKEEEIEGKGKRVEVERDRRMGKELKKVEIEGKGKEIEGY